MLKTEKQTQFFFQFNTCWTLAQIWEKLMKKLNSIIVVGSSAEIGE